MEKSPKMPKIEDYTPEEKRKIDQTIKEMLNRKTKELKGTTGDTYETEKGPSLIDIMWAEELQRKLDAADKERAIQDQIAKLTDERQLILKELSSSIIDKSPAAELPAPPLTESQLKELEKDIKHEEERLKFQEEQRGFLGKLFNRPTDREKSIEKDLEKMREKFKVAQDARSKTDFERAKKFSGEHHKERLRDRLNKIDSDLKDLRERSERNRHYLKK